MGLIQFLEKAGLAEPAKWVKDEDVWAKAKKVARKGDAEDPWALTTYLYKKMGGEIKPKQEGGPGSGRYPKGSGENKDKPTIKDSETSIVSQIDNIGIVAGSVKGDSLHIGSAEVISQKQGQGYGTQLYKSLVDHAFKKGLSVSSDETVEEPAARVYNSLKKLGYKVTQNPNAKEGSLSDGSKFLYAPKGQSVFKVTKEADKTGVQTTHWFWGSEAFAPKQEKKPHVVDQPEVKSSGEQAAQKLLIDNPSIPAATLLNALKSQGIELVDSKKQLQADSGTSQVAVQRESSIRIQTDARFVESQTTTRNAGVGPLRFKVALIQEGLGNLKDAFFYGKEAIKSGIQAFEGRKCFADHPSMSEEQDRPERSVRDIIGHFENVAVQENDDGSLALVADLVMPPDPPFEWARALVRQATEYNKKYPEQNFVGLSINANGDAQEVPFEDFAKNYKLPESCKPKLMRAREDGMNSVKLVTSIKDAVSCDLVTEPGAKGKILEILESERATMKKENEKKGKIEAEEKKQMMAEEKEEEKMHAAEEKKEADGDDEDHEDIEKDKKLILDMIKKHMGDEEGEMEVEAEEAAMEAYEAYKAMGESEDEAMKCAGKAMKLAKHMAEKKAKMEAEMKHAESEGEEEKKESEPKKESAHVVKLEARLAFLERELKKRDLDVMLDSKLKESGLGRAETDRIRKLIGSPKSESHIVETIKIFKEAFESRSESVSKSDFFVSLEKPSAPVKKSKVSFSECI